MAIKKSYCLSSSATHFELYLAGREIFYRGMQAVSEQKAGIDVNVKPPPRSKGKEGVTARAGSRGGDRMLDERLRASGIRDPGPGIWVSGVGMKDFGLAAVCGAKRWSTHGTIGVGTAPIMCTAPTMCTASARRRRCAHCGKLLL